MSKIGRAIGLVAITLAISPAISINFAVAASTAPTVPVPSPYKSSLDKFRVDRDNYFQAMKVRSQQIRVINNDFKVACDLATSNFLREIAIARTPDQKNLAISSRKSAISAAIVARDLAISALGLEPATPIEPQKPVKEPKGKSR
jgi:hypothetical protein